MKVKKYKSSSNKGNQKNIEKFAENKNPGYTRK
jgi:hypothetical protein